MILCSSTYHHHMRKIWLSKSLTSNPAFEKAWTDHRSVNIKVLTYDESFQKIWVDDRVNIRVI